MERLGAVLRFGSTVVEVLDRRKGGTFGEDGVYREYLDFNTVASYGFLPWAEGRPPKPRDRLHGVEVRRQLGDTVGLREAWSESFGRMRGLSALGPRCEESLTFRYHASKAAFDDSIRMTLVAEVIEAGDGRSYEAFLTTRVETPELAAYSWDGGDGPSSRQWAWETVPCPGVG